MTEPSARPKSTRSAWPIVGIALIVLLILTLIGAGVGVSVYNSNNPKVAQPQYYSSYPPVNRLGGPPGGGPRPPESEADATTVAEIALFLGQFGRALPTKNLGAEPWIEIGVLRNEGRLGFDPPDASGVALGPLIDDRTPDIEAENRALEQIWYANRRKWRTWNWPAMVLSRVNRTGTQEWHAYVHYPKPDGSRDKIRWTIIRNDRTPTFAITQWMNLNTGWESSHEFAAARESFDFERPEYHAFGNFSNVSNAHAAMDSGKLDEARRALDAVARKGANPRQKYQYELAEARYSVLTSVPEEAAERLEEVADQNSMHLPTLALLMQSLKTGRERQRIPDLARRYQSVAGPDADALTATGSSALADGRTEEARDAFDQALKLQPDHAEALTELFAITPSEDCPNFVDRVTKLKTFPKLFTRIAPGFWRDNGQYLLQLGQAHRRFTGTEVAARFIVSAELRQKKFADAENSFQIAVEKLTGEARSELIRDFLSVSLAMQRGLEAYEAIPKRDRREAFRTVMATWANGIEESSPRPTPEQQKIRRENRDRFDKLLDAHAKNHPADPLLLAYRSLSQNVHEDYKSAEMSAATFLEQIPWTGHPEDDTKSRAELTKRQWLFAKLGLNQVASAIERYPDEASFETLAAEAVRRQLTEPLATLIRSRENQSPVPADTAYWRGEYLRLKKEYRRAAQEFLAYLYAREVGEYFRHEYAARDQLVRCWMKSGNADDALEFLKAEKNPQPVLYALALAAKSPEEAEVYLLDAVAKQAWIAFQMYNDPDLGPILKGPDFARLRKKYPEPMTPNADE